MRSTFTSELCASEQQLLGHLGDAVLLVERVRDEIHRPGSDRRIAAEGLVLKQRARQTEHDLITLVARQAPVACDLKLMLAMIHVAQHAALIANQFGLIGEQLAEIDPTARDRHGTADRITRMATLAGAQLDAASRAFATRDPAAAARIEREDDRIDELNRDIFAAAQAHEVAPELRELVLRHVLIGRSIERIGDNAVRIAAHAVSLAHGDIHHLAAAPAAVS